MGLSSFVKQKKLNEYKNIEPKRMILVSYAKYRPTSSNNTKKRQSSNRINEIILMSTDFDFFRESTDQLQVSVQQSTS